MKQDITSKQIWEQFLKNESTIEKHNLKNDIISSWHYCKNNEVNPYDGVANHILDSSTLAKKQKDNTLLLQIAKPHIEQLQDFIKDWHYIVTITDNDGYILLEQGEKTVHKEARKINFTTGSKWVEREVGTNAIGLALRLQKPITVMGYEHYSRASQQWNCTASPIYDHDGKVLGVFNVSSLYRSLNYNYILACIKLAANSISLAWKQQIEEDINTLKQSNLLKKDNIIICLFNDEICSMSENLYAAYRQYIGQSIQTLITEENLVVSGNQISITHKDREIGYTVSIPVPKKQSSIYFKGIIGTSESFQEVLEKVKKVAKRSTAVHIYGETGVGKELIAESIHESSLYADGPFLTVNCGAVPESLMASELFGYEHGAFTGASNQGSKGKLESADGGTLFLDEIEEMSLSMQVFLLRALQEKKITRIGGKKEISLNFRIITASNEDIRHLVKQKRFREDLFYRLYVFPITIPPLRDRKEDIKHMIQYYLKENNWFPTWQAQLEDVFTKADWRGNVRELFNALERCEILYRDERPTKEKLLEQISVLNPMTFTDIKESLRFTEELEKESIKRELIKYEGNVSMAAEALSMSRATLYRKLKKYNL